jgi:formylglycine-generating enzyme
MKNVIRMMFLAVVIGLGSAAMAVDIVTVPVGNAGNLADTEVMTTDGTTRYGAVDYEYNIGKYEVTAGQYCEFLNAVAKTDTYGLYNANMDSHYRGCQITQNNASGNYTYDFSGGTFEAPGSTAADWENRPVGTVSWGDAARFANWLHNGQPTGAQDLTTTEDGAYYLNGATHGADLLAIDRESDATWAITSEDEWYKAAYYDPSLNAGAGGYYNYPTSTNSVPSNNLVEPTDPGTNVTVYAGAVYPDPSGHTIGSPYWRTEVGAHENSDSPYGTFDQGGNLWEWNEASIGSRRGFRGAQFNSDDSGLHASHRQSYFSTYHGYGIGFRVVEVPEPATMAILVLGGIGILRRRKCVQR